MSKGEEEIKAYYEVKKLDGPEWKRQAKTINLISNDWFIRWKEYVNKDYLSHKLGLSNKKDRCRSDKFLIKSYPGKINNEKLIISLDNYWNDGDIYNKENIVVSEMKQNFKFVSERKWNFLYSKYKGGPEIACDIIHEKDGQSVIDLYKVKYIVLFLPKKSEIIGNNQKIENHITANNQRIIYLSKYKLISQLKEKLVQLENKKRKKKITVGSIRLWKCPHQVSELVNLISYYFGKKSYEEDKTIINKSFLIDSLSYLETIDEILDKKFFKCDDLILVEEGEKQEDFYFEIPIIQTKEGKCSYCKEEGTLYCFCSCKNEWYCNAYCKSNNFKEHMKQCPNHCLEENYLKRSARSKLGVVGLANLGNTCYMNTSLQCMSNCWELTNYFLMDYYKSHINETNPLGTKGILARAFANIIKNLWDGEHNTYSPHNFKAILEQVQSIFIGNTQQDTQEFLTYLMDGLHEDLNRVLVKPYIQGNDNKKIDVIKSLEEWYTFQKRNQSILFDLFYGQFKSLIFCPNEKCQNISTTFEPFLTLSLPLLNQIHSYEIICFFIYYDIANKPVKLTLPFASDCSIMALRNKTAKILNIHPFSFLVVKMNGNGDLSYYANCSQLLSVNLQFSNKDNRYPYFLLQHNPKIFYNPINNSSLENDNTKYRTDYSTLSKDIEMDQTEIKKLFSDDYEENESGVPENSPESYYQIKNETYGKIMIENNHGLTSDFIMVLLYISIYLEHDKREYKAESKGEKYKNILFPRVIYLNKAYTCKKIHYVVFEFLQPVFELYNKKFEEVFPDINTDNSNDTPDYHRIKKYPYRLRIMNIMNNRGACLICGKNQCNNCLLPYNEQTFNNLISKYPKQNKKTIDNTFFYLSETQRQFSKKENWNRDFSLQITTFGESYDKLYSSLNDHVVHDFKITKSDFKAKIEIDKCFSYFTRWEKLDNTNEYYCVNCKSQQKAKKKMEVFKSPHFLIIHLKRFKGNNKLETFVDFPINGLDMRTHVVANEEQYPLVYDLFGVANHVGDTSFGHYYAFCKNPISCLWYKFDDSNVTPIGRNEIVTPNAYVLFYRRRNIENLLDLMSLYKSSFINMESVISYLEPDLKAINELINEK